jgi:hypothetical protein
MTANVKSSDFCGNVYVNAGLNGTLTSFSNPTFATPQTKFGLGIRQFFLGQVASAEAHIRSTRLGSVTLRSASYYYSWTLYDGGSGSNVTGSITSYGSFARTDHHNGRRTRLTGFLNFVLFVFPCRNSSLLYDY